MIRYLGLVCLVTGWTATLQAQSLAEYPASFSRSRYFQPSLFLDRPGAFSARRPAAASILRYDVYAPYRPHVSTYRYYDSVVNSPRGLDASRRLYASPASYRESLGRLPVDDSYRSALPVYDGYGSTLNDPSTPFGTDIYWRGYNGH